LNVTGIHGKREKPVAVSKLIVMEIPLTIASDIDSLSSGEAAKQHGVASRGHAKPIDKDLLLVDP